MLDADVVRRGSPDADGLTPGQLELELARFGQQLEAQAAELHAGLAWLPNLLDPAVPDGAGAPLSRSTTRSWTPGSGGPQVAARVSSSSSMQPKQEMPAASVMPKALMGTGWGMAVIWRRSWSGGATLMMSRTHGTRSTAKDG